MFASRNFRGRLVGFTLAGLLVAGPAAASDWTVDTAGSSLSFVAMQNMPAIQQGLSSLTEVNKKPLLVVYSKN